MNSIDNLSRKENSNQMEDVSQMNITVRGVPFNLQPAFMRFPVPNMAAKILSDFNALLKKEEETRYLNIAMRIHQNYTLPVGGKKDDPLILVNTKEKTNISFETLNKLTANFSAIFSNPLSKQGMIFTVDKDHFFVQCFKDQINIIELKSLSCPCLMRGKTSKVVRALNVAKGCFETLIVAQKNYESRIKSQGFFLREIHSFSKLHCLQPSPDAIIDLPFLRSRLVAYSQDLYCTEFKDFLIKNSSSLTHSYRLNLCLKVILAYQTLQERLKKIGDVLVGHGQIKLENLLINEANGQIVLLDIKPLRNLEVFTHTPECTLLEDLACCRVNLSQAEWSRNIELHDLFGIGQVMYTILTSRLPFNDLEEGEYITRDCRCDFNLLIRYPSSVIDIIIRLLSFERLAMVFYVRLGHCF